MRRGISDQHRRRPLRPIEIRSAARVAAGEAALLGQRHHRVRHIPRGHRRTMAAGESRRALSRPRNRRWLSLAGFTCVGLVTSLGISRVPAADPAKKFRWNPLGDFGAQIEDDALRTAFSAGPSSAIPIFFSLRRCCSSRSSSTGTTFCTLTRRTSAICRPPLASASGWAALRPAIFPAEKLNTA